MIILLLKYGADSNIADRIGQGPLRQSMKAATPDCMQLLLKTGCNVDHKDHWKQTALLSAICYPNPVPFIRPLLLAEADINVKDIHGNTSLMEAVRYARPEVVRLLRANRADKNGFDNAGDTPVLLAFLCNAHAKLQVLLSYRLDHRIRTKRATPSCILPHRLQT